MGNDRLPCFSSKCCCGISLLPFAVKVAISGARASSFVSCLKPRNGAFFFSFFLLSAQQIWFNFKPHKHIYQKIAKERKKNHAILHHAIMRTFVYLTERKIAQWLRFSVKSYLQMGHLIWKLGIFLRGIPKDLKTATIPNFTSCTRAIKWHGHYCFFEFFYSGAANTQGHFI